MNDDAPLRKQWISSLDVINKTGISRATLNNYIKINLLPRPAVKRPETTDARARMLGYFPDSVIETIIQIKELKKQGYSMDAIADRFKRSHLAPAIDSGGMSMQEETQSKDTQDEAEAPLGERFLSQTISGDAGQPFKVTINDITFPAYLLNNNYEIDWINKDAENAIFQEEIHTIKEPTSRNIFQLLLRNRHENQQAQTALIDFHLSFVKGKTAKSELGHLYEGMSPRERANLEKRYDCIVSPPRQA
ncbi:MAG: MerR family transcriptional regulator, partial [Smithella sp.]